MLNLSRNIYGASPSTYANAALGNGGQKPASGGIIPASDALSADLIQLKMLDLQGVNAVATAGYEAWTLSGHIPAGDIAIHAKIGITTDTVSTFPAIPNHTLSLLYAFSVENLLPADAGTTTSQLEAAGVARKAAWSQLASSARILKMALPAVAATGTTLFRVHSTDRVTVRARYLYVWVEHQQLNFKDAGTAVTANQLTWQVNLVS